MLQSNRKRYLIILLTTLLVVILVATSLSGCSADDEDYYDLDTTYAMAQELGYEGTLDEFIELISGKDGVDGRGIVSFELASSNGGIDTYVITFSDGKTHSFTVKNGVDGASVNQGYSAYEVWEQLPENNGKSVSDFIEAISGKDGENGSSVTAVEAATNYAIGSSASVVAGVYGGTSRGSAIIYKDDASNKRLYLLTNYHVVYDTMLDSVSSNVKIYLYGMAYYTDGLGNYVGGINATYVGGSYTNDIAVLALTADSYDDYIEYRNKCGNLDSQDPDSDYFIRPVTQSANIAAVGDTAIAIGNPSGLGISATSGIVSVDSENIRLSLTYTKTINTRVMRIDTAVNSGNSGGGLFTSDGSWIGIVNAKASSSSIENIAYAIPHELASAIADNVLRGYERQLSDDDATNDKNHVSVTMPTLGVSTTAYNSYVNVINGKATIMEEVTVAEITAGTNIASALIARNDENAIREGDVLVNAKIGGQTYQLTRIHTLKELLYSIDQPEILILTVKRGNQTKQLTINITANDIGAVN